MKRISILLICITFISISCKKTVANDNNQAVSVTDSIPTNNTDISTEEDTLRLPIVYDKEGISIFLPGLYRNNEPSDFKYMLSEEWYSIYLDSLSKDSYLQKAAIRVQKEPDDCLGLGDSSTYVQNTTDERVELFIKGIKPQDLHLKTLHHTQTSVWTKSQYSFDWGGQKYTLRAEGISDPKQRQFDKDELGRTTCWEESPTNYKLYLSLGQQTQLLIAIPHLNNTNVQIVFIGDLDEDGKPDFIFDTSAEYEEKAYVLFLSSKAKNGEIVRCVGESSYQFDC